MAGLLFVWPDVSPSAAADAAAAEPPVSQGLRAFNGRLVWYMRDIPYSYDVLMENLADPAHVFWLHHKLVPTLRRELARPFELVPLVTPESSYDLVAIPQSLREPGARPLVAVSAHVGARGKEGSCLHVP